MNDGAVPAITWGARVPVDRARGFFALGADGRRLRERDQIDPDRVIDRVLHDHVERVAGARLLDVERSPSPSLLRARGG